MARPTALIQSSFSWTTKQSDVRTKRHRLQMASQQDPAASVEASS